jgi:lycopene cyclase domain-containing protein
MSTYLLINILSITVPLLFSFDPRLLFHRKWYAVLPAILGTGTVFILWDVVFTRWGVWGFNPAHLVGVYFLGLPIEEWLFFFCIPYACLFTYVSLNTLIERDLFAPYARQISWALVAVLGILAIANIERTYTSVTFAATASFLLLHLLLFKSNYLGRFYLAYLVIFMFPFLIVNGILTGSFLTEPVVWYDNQENLALRIFTIPIEDFVYGLLLFLLNVTIYEKLIVSKGSKQNYVFESRLWLPVPREEVFEFFSKAENLQRITPSWLNFRILTPLPIKIMQDRMIDYRIKLFGIPIHWKSEISVWEPPDRFVDRQIKGPYRMWIHTHRFESIESGGTMMIDRVEYMPKGWFLAPLLNRLFVMRNVKKIFDYRKGEILRIFAVRSNVES